MGPWATRATRAARPLCPSSGGDVANRREGPRERQNESSVGQETGGRVFMSGNPAGYEVLSLWIREAHDLAFCDDCDDWRP